ncbi:MAG: ABC transporter permease [Acidimicrobiales bacterium]
MRFVVRRVSQLVPSVAGIVGTTFLLVHLAPGDAVEALAGENASQEYLAALRVEYGLDQALPTQIWRYITHLIQGDLGQSVLLGQPVTTLIAERMTPTLLLAASALILSTMGALGVAVRAGRRPGGVFDAASNSLTLVAYAIPVFWLGQIAVLVLALGLGWFPVQGFTDARAPGTGLARWIGIAHHLALPALVLAASETALLARLTRSGLLANLGRAYVLTARAKGVAEGRILSAHALRNALLPVITVVGSRIGFILSGAVLVESVFAWPGLGSLLVESARSQDHPVVLGLVMLVSATVVTMNLAVDLLYRVVDPRVTNT